MASGSQQPAAQGSAGLHGPALFRSGGPNSHPTPILRRGGGPAYATALDKALDALLGQRYRDASLHVGNALELDKSDRLAWLALSVLRLQTGNFGGAETAAKRAQAIDPVEPLADRILLTARVGGGNPDARRGLRRLVADGVESARPLSLYVDLLEGRPDPVADALSALEPVDSDPFLAHLAAISAVRVGEFARGERFLRTLLADTSAERFEENQGVLATFLPERPLQAGSSERKAPARMGGARGRLSGVARLEPGIVPTGTSMVVYTIAGQTRIVVNTAPFEVNWDTRRVPDGRYGLTIDFYDRRGRAIDIRTNELLVAHPERSDLEPDPSSPDWREAFELRLTKGIAPVASRCAAYTELAAVAARRGDTEGALSALENVCAIDPSYRDAKGSVHRFNRRYVTPGTGYWQGPASRKRVAMTFDDGPNPLPDRTPVLLDQLRDLQVPATFFIVGERALMCPDLLKRIDAEGHELANHSHTHRDLTDLSGDDIWRELCRASVVIRDAVGVRPRFYRPPGGQLNTTVSRCAASLGMDGGYWTVDGYTFEMPPYRPAELADFVVANTVPGAILLLHNAPDNTLEALAGIVRRLRKQGYEFTTLSNLVRGTASETRPIRSTNTRQSSSRSTVSRPSRGAGYPPNKP